MNCPYCGNQMEKGFIEQTKILWPLEWTPAKAEPRMFQSRERNIKMTSASKGGRLYIHHCADCQKFIIDQTELEV